MGRISTGGGVGMYVRVERVEGIKLDLLMSLNASCNL